MEQHYIGVDLHKAFFQACALRATGERLWESRFPRTAEGLMRFREHCSAAVQIAVEASGPTWSFVDQISSTVGRVCVVDTRKTRLKAGSAAKTDRLDARRLADALRRDSVVGVYIPVPAVRELRELCRGRHHVVRIRVRLAHMMRALLLRVGVADAPMRQLFSARGRAWWEQVALPPEAALTRQRLTRVLKAVQLEAVDADRRVIATAAADPMAVALQQLVGMGPIRALTIRAEIGDIARFPSGAELASYAGLVPRVDASADRYRCGRITRTGSPWLRWGLVEAAIKAMKRQDQIGRWARHLVCRKGIFKARVALARVLCHEIVRVWPRSA
jgi:transposase